MLFSRIEIVLECCAGGLWSAFYISVVKQRVVPSTSFNEVVNLKMVSFFMC
jgi:hypothetical protein